MNIKTDLLREEFLKRAKEDPFNLLVKLKLERGQELLTAQTEASKEVQELISDPDSVFLKNNLTFLKLVNK